ncbi:MAG TPA: GNAT family N-acetyltransferase, partial [Desulfobacteraceae bacterium]|nr:GNAT family N-acetyltransferase [Desulfobacteraceae bacterium]
NTIQELFDCAELTAKQPRPMGTGLAVITNGSSPGVMVTDELYRSGQALAPLPEQVSAELDKILPASRGRTNPVCLAEDAAPQSVRDVLDVCVRATEIHGVLMALAPPPLSDPADLAEALLAALSGRSFPVIICLMGGARIAGAMAMLNQAGIPTYETPERAVKACLCLREYARNRAALTQIPPRMTRHLGINREIAVDLLGKPKDGEVMPDPDCRAVLTAYGMKVLPSALAETAKEAVEKAREMGFPLAMKLLSPDITHKIEAGGVKLGLRSEDEVREAFGQIMSSAAASQAAKGGVLIQPFMDQPDYEISLSSRQDPVFGPVIGFGPGGIFSEISRDRALGLPPMNRLLASHLIEATHVSEVLKGVRNRPPADVEQLQDLIIRLSQLMIDFPEIQELDMNPVLIKDTKAVLAGARLRVARTHIRSPHHLVISPYPAEYEKTVTAKDGSPILLRPVRPEDAPMFQEFYKVLSSKSLYYRFFTPIRELKPDMLARFTQIDYDREIALVAIAEEAGVEKMLGVARIMGDPDATTGEFAVMVGDPWHGKGIGGKILRYCLDIARDRKFKTVEGYVLAENSGMINLGKKMGFNVTRDGSEVVLKQTF